MIMNIRKLIDNSFLFKRKRKTIWLSKLITNNLKQNRSINIIQFVKNYFSTNYVPSKLTIILILSIIVIILFLTNSGKLLTLLGLEEWILIRIHYFSKESNYFQNLVTIHAGIGAIIFSLIILIAESMRDHQSKDTARVLLKVSYLFPLTITEIFAFFLFLFGDVNYLSVITIIIIAFLTVISLKRTISVLLDKPLFIEKRIELLNEQIGKKINLAIDERIGNNILLKSFEKSNHNIKYLMSSVDETNNFLFNSQEFGVVSDIDIGTLNEIAEMLKNKNQLLTDFYDYESTLTNQTKNKNETIIYIHKSYKDTINEDNRTLISIPKSQINNLHLIDIINNRVQRAFKINPKPIFDELVESQLGDLKDQYYDSIINEKISVIEELNKIYIGVAKGYLNCMKPYGGGFSFDQARKERNAAFLGGWEEMRWLATDIRSLIEKAIKKKNLEILHKTLWLPFKISSLAFQEDDHYLFQEFSNFPNLFYLFSLREENKQVISKILFDKSWNFYKNLSDYFIETKLSKNIPKSKKHSLKDFALTILLTYQNLMKAAYDNFDFGGFVKFQTTTLSLFKEPSAGYIKYDLDYLISQLNDKNISIERKKQIQNQIDLEQIYKEIQDRRLQMFFGLASWIFDKFKKNQTNETIKQIYNYVQSIFDIPLNDFTKIFLNTHSFEVEDFWNWGFWDMIADSSFHSIKILEKLEQFYAVKALLLLTKIEKDKRDHLELPYNREFAYLAEGSRDLMHVLNDITNNPNSWRFVLQDNSINKVDVLKNLLLEAKEKQEKRDINKKRQTPISNLKVKNFKEKFIDEFYKHADLRIIIERESTIEKKLSIRPEETLSRFGINRVDDKAAFIENWHVHFIDWGENYGRNLALGENSVLINEIINGCETIDAKELENVFGKFRNMEDLIILVINSSPYLIFQGLDNFEYQNRLDIRPLSGIYKFQGADIPIYQIFQSKIEEQIIILSRRKINKLIQYSPMNDNENEDMLKDIFYINVQSFSENVQLMSKLINDPPAWLKENRDKYEQRLYLKELVLIEIFERFTLLFSDEYNGYRILTKNYLKLNKKDSDN